MLDVPHIRFAQSEASTGSRAACVSLIIYHNASLKQIAPPSRHEETVPVLGEHYEDLETHLNRQAEEEEEEDDTRQTELNLVFLMCYRMMTMTRYY